MDLANAVGEQISTTTDRWWLEVPQLRYFSEIGQLAYFSPGHDRSIDLSYSDLDHR